MITNLKKLTAAITNFCVHFSRRLVERSFKPMIFITLFFSLAFRVTAGGVEEVPVLSRLSGLVANPTLNSQPLVLNATAVTICPTPVWQPERIRNIISLNLLEESPIYIANNLNITVDVEIKYGANSGSTNTINHQFAVTYDKNAGTKYNPKSIFSFEGAKYVQAKVTAINVTGMNANDAMNLLLLENAMMIRYAYVLNPNAVPSPFSHSSSTGDAFPVTWAWPVNTGNNFTQLEWTWLENELAHNYMNGPNVDVEKLFRNNSTRVELAASVNTYSIPHFYDGSGKIYYRIRPVLKDATDASKNGVWRYPASPFSLNNPDTSLNWQVNTSFAEDGKRKTVMQYFDGSLRARQTVTKDNLTNTTVVAETFYDGEGRPVIQVLPAPTMQTVISYTKNLNLFNSQLPNTDPLAYFDLEPVLTPGSATERMDTSTGAAKYYSGSNPELNTNDLMKNVPNAEGYPYTVTRYTPDATGRIMAQSGVGSAFRMGGGHETKYYYGNASQEELDGLFGTEVGNKTHYFKNMIQDANGQMSVSYVDMHGRTIATALAGLPPDNLIGLDKTNPAIYPNQAGTQIVRDLLDGNTNIVKGNTVESITSLLVPARSLYTFTYKLDTASLQLPTCSLGTKCYDCMYELEIVITDESGDTLPIVRKFSNINPAADDLCTTPVSYFKDENGVTIPNNLITIPVVLRTGSYNIRKTLRLSESSLQHYKEQYLLVGLCKTEQQIIDSIYNVWSAISGCGNIPSANDCQDCYTQLGDSTTFRNAYLASIGNPPLTSELTVMIRVAYQSALQNCQNLCNKVSPMLNSTRQMMLADMTPYSGQYARDSVATTTLGLQLHNKYNIFSTTNPTTQPFYKKPKQANGAANGFYYDPFNAIDLSIHPTGSTNPYTYLNGTSNDDFTAMFVNKWAESLLPYHPEFPKLQFAEANLTNSYNWIHRFNQVNTYQQAVDSGFIFTASANMIDPFYVVAPSYKSQMDTMIKTNYKNGVSMWQIAYGEVKCKDIVDQTARDFCYTTTAPKVPPFTGLTTAEKNRAWQVFRGLYANERNFQVNAYIAANVTLTDAADLVTERYILRFPTSNTQAATQYGWSWYPTVPGGAPNTTGMTGGSTPAQVYSGRCSSYVSQWKLNLLECAAIASHPSKDSILAKITRGMVEVCEKGSDDLNPYGSSNVAPTTPFNGKPRSFEEVIYSVFTQYNIPRNTYCNSYLIEFPKPYGHGQQLAPTYTSFLDTCTCEKFQQLKNNAQQAGYNPNNLATLNNYFRQTFKDTISASLFTSLNKCGDLGPQVVCTTVTDTIYYNCEGIPPVCLGEVRQGQRISEVKTKEPIGIFNRVPLCPPGYVWNKKLNACVPELILDDCYIICSTQVCDSTSGDSIIVLPNPEILPSFLNCGSTNIDSCYTCDELRVLTKAFKDTFNVAVNSGNYYPYNTGPVFSNTVLSDADIEHNILYARFMNYRTGMQLTWQEYAAAAAAANCDLTLLPNGSNVNVVCRDSTFLTDTTGIIVTDTACTDVRIFSIALGQEIYNIRTQNLLANFEAMYREKCLAAKNREQFTVAFTNSEYHYTLYYYDMAGNLVKTVPPKGANPDFSSAFLLQVKNARTAGTHLPRVHSFVTEYRYNSLNQVVAQKTPDAGTSNFWYDRLGRMVVSKNAQQALSNRYSYTLYDALGRIVEVGQKPNTTAMTQVISQDTTALKNWILTTGSAREQLTISGYDFPYGYEVYPNGILGHQGYMNQRNLRNRISYSMVKNSPTDTMHIASFFTYDIHGNVDTLIQDYKAITAMGAADRFKMITYDYDLISGKVNGVDYQPRQADAFYHRYSYDAENRIIAVRTSRDSIVWERDASYRYYKHGPLARTVLGELQVQGQDFVYTMQGWLKGMNSSLIGNGSHDAGGDNGTTVARDVFGFALHYFDDGASQMDYRAIGGTNSFARPNNSEFKSLYNGNIGAMSVNNNALARATSGVNAAPLFYKYRYDQLNRLVSMNTYKNLNANNTWTPIGINDYGENIKYDPNGNILKYNRLGAPETGQQLRMDSMTYLYWANTNRLKQVIDSVPNGNYTDDINTQTATDNYVYDAIGNLIEDKSEGMSMTWNVYGKLTQVTKSSGAISYRYDASGNRVSKLVGSKTTVYVRDATGNVLSVYEKDGANALEQGELNIYGSARLGMGLKRSQNIANVALQGSYGSAKVFGLTRNEKVFELSNHLGNVLVTVSDKKEGQDLNSDQTIDYYQVDVKTATDYYPFGMLMPGRRHFVGSQYTYGFNGKENDNEVKGEGNQIDYGMRIYDPRLGKFLSVDLLTRKYPMLSPFQYASNRPIDGIDLDGLEYLPYHKSMYQLEYSTTTSTITSGNGKQTTATTENVIVNTVYANIPTSLQDSKTNSFKYVSGGPVTAWGRDWDTDKDGAIVYQTGKYYHKGPKFYGMANGGQDPEPTASTSGMGGAAVNSARNNAANATAGALGEEGAGVIANQFNKKIWYALGKEQELRRGFYNATNMVDAYRANNLIGDKSLLNASGRTGLINFLTDGSLNISFADGLKDGFINDRSSVWADYSTIRRNIYGNALKIAYTGLQIMQRQGIEIRPETISDVQGTLQKYKANGGGTEYDNINQYTTLKK